MPIQYMKAGLTLAWILVIGVLGYAAGPRSVGGWTVLLAVALTPPLIVLRFSTVPSESMSQRIQDVLRR
jgi:hypothetical protein